LLGAHAPAVLSELEGLAEGSGCRVLDLYLHSGFEFFLDTPFTGCSAIAVGGSAGAIVAQNWDAPPDVIPSLALFLHIGPAGFEYAIIGSIGMLGWVGCNRAGLALVNNDMMLDAEPGGLPSQVVRRIVLAQPTVEAALARLSDLPHMSGRSYLLGDATGHVAGIEVSPSVGMRQVSDKVAIHTNHALSPDLREIEDEPLLRATYPSSFHRLDILKRAVPHAATVRDVTRILSNVEGAPAAVSKSPAPGEPTQTAFSVIFDCSNHEMHLCAGRPDIGAYTTHHLSSTAEVAAADPTVAILNRRTKPRERRIRSRLASTAG
jgi:isopenicillin-N N-acyltransferase-like protein